MLYKQNYLSYQRVIDGTSQSKRKGKAAGGNTHERHTKVGYTDRNALDCILFGE
jgi:hypothetical protein